MSRALDWLFAAAGVLAAVLLAVIAALTLAEIIGRAVGILVPLGTEFGGFTMAASIFLGLGWTLRKGGHIRVNLLIRHLGKRARWYVEFWCLVFAAGSILAVVYGSANMVWNSYRFGSLATGLVAVPLWIPQTCMLLGVVLLELALLEQLARLLSGREPSYLQHEDENLGVE